MLKKTKNKEEIKKKNKNLPKSKEYKMKIVENKQENKQKYIGKSDK